MLILRGHLKGHIFTLHQFANDWVTAQELPQPINITSVAFSVSEYIRMTRDKHVGQLWNWYRIEPNTILPSLDFPFRLVRRRR